MDQRPARSGCSRARFAHAAAMDSGRPQSNTMTSNGGRSDRSMLSPRSGLAAANESEAELAAS